MEKENLLQLLQKLSYISRLRIDDSQKEDFMNKIDNFIEWSSKINEINTDNIAPMFNVIEWLGHYNENLREDKVTVPDYSKELIENAPDKEYMFITVPKIIE